MHKRLIPVLLIDRDKRLVKTIRFGGRTYIGDPLNVIRLFNEKEVDELIFLDIDASRNGRRPDFDYIREVASECFMPLSYGGGIESTEDCERLNRDGVEKFVLGKSAKNFSLIKKLTSTFGSQAVSACVDVKTGVDGVQCLTTAGSCNISPEDFCAQLEHAGVGEIIIQSVNNDGLRTGYDLPLIGKFASKLQVPLVALGGAGEYSHLQDALRVGASAAASGSTFCFIGRLRAVLINYPDAVERLKYS